MAKQELTLKQRKWIKFYVECGSLTEAAEKAGYKATTRKSFCAIGAENLEKLGYKIRPILIAKGLDGFAVADVLKDARNAIYFSGRKEIPDHKIRLDAVDKIAKLGGLYASEKREVTGKDGGPIEIKPKGSIFDKLDKYAKLFESNGGGEEGPAPGDGAGESVDTAPADDKAG